MHPVLQAAIDNPRFPKPYNWAAVTLKPKWRNLPVANYLEPLIILDCEMPSHPASDGEKGRPWPLYDEYVAERLGKDAIENSKSWNTAIWIDCIYQIAMLPACALGPLHWFSSGSEFANEEVDGYSATDVIPPDVLTVLHILDGVERIRRKESGYELVGTHEASSSRDPRLPTGVEIRADANKLLRLLIVGTRGLWKPLKRAIVDHTEMWKLGITQGASRQMAPTAGRQRVVDGLGMAADIRRDVLRWERSPHRLSGNPCSPLGSKAGDLPSEWRTGANDDCRRLKLAA